MYFERFIQSARLIVFSTLDDGAADYKNVQTEFYTEARVSFCKALDGAKQEPKFGN